MRFYCIAFVLCLLVSGQVGAAGEETAAAAAPRIGFLDVTLVLEAYTRRTELEEEIRVRQAELSKQEHALLDKMNELQGEIEQLAMGTPERAELLRQREAAVKETRQFRATNMNALNRRVAETMQSLFEDVVAETRAVGREQGYDLILKHQSTTSELAAYEDVAIQMAKQVVLYAKPEYDLTQEVAARLNARYADRKAAGAENDNRETR